MNRQHVGGAINGVGHYRYNRRSETDSNIGRRGRQCAGTSSRSAASNEIFCSRGKRPGRGGCGCGGCGNTLRFSLRESQLPEIRKTRETWKNTKNTFLLLLATWAPGKGKRGETFVAGTRDTSRTDRLPPAINKLTSQPANQPTHQSTDRPTDGPTDRPTDQPPTNQVNTN